MGHAAGAADRLGSALARLSGGPLPGRHPVGRGRGAGAGRGVCLAEAAALPRLVRFSLGMHALLALVASAAMMGVVALLLAIPFGREMFGALYSEAWSRRWRTRPRSPGWRSASGSGWRWRTRRAVQRRGPVWQRALRYLLGVIGLVAIWMGLRIIFPQEPLVLGLALRTVRYALAMLWAIVLWPWLLVRIGMGSADPV